MEESAIEKTATGTPDSKPFAQGTSIATKKWTEQGQRFDDEIGPDVELVSCQLFPTDSRHDLLLMLGLLILASIWVFSFSNFWGLILLTIYLLAASASKLAQRRIMKVLFFKWGFKIKSLNYAGLMGTSRCAPWEDLRAVRLAYELPQARFGDPFCSEWASSGFLVFDLVSGGCIFFPLRGIDQLSSEKLFLSLAKWVSPLVLNSDVLAMQRNVLSQGTAPADLGFTRIWEETLKSRFEATNFVPLAGGHHLQCSKYSVLLLLVCGGLSAVYLAEKNNRQRVILKEMFLPAGIAHTTRIKSIELFEREARILATLKHKQIARIIDYFVEEGRTYLVIEHIAGLTLRQLVALQGPQNEERVLRLAKQIADILFYLHNSQPAIIHRDLTPDNLIVKDDDTVVLIDFGAATEMVETATGTLIGKQSYIPSEQFRGRATPQSDIYALGGTMHFLLTGADPEPLSQSHPRLIRSQVSLAMDRIVADCTEFEPQSRIGSADQLVWRINELLQPVTVLPSGDNNE